MKTAIERIEEYSRFSSILGLERIRELLERLGRPQDGMRCIHVAGTNGKGSVSRYIYEALEANGYKVGIYTSPFIDVFEERIEFDHEMIPKEELEKATDRVIRTADEMVSEGKDSPTEFEIITAIAFCYFETKNPDFVILEVGLGGRGDATNVIENPVISIITSISYDHMDRLGNTLGEIAAEKAGIIKEGVPVVINVSEREPAQVLAREAYKKHSVLRDASRIKWEKIENVGCGSKFTTWIDGTDFQDVVIHMAGDHQIENTVTALAAIEIMRKSSIIKVERERLYSGLEAAFQKGRFEVRKNGRFVLDGAHNPEGMEALVKTVDDYYYGEDALVVMGVLQDKAVDEIVELARHLGDTFILTEPPSDRKLSAESLAAKLEAKGKTCIICKEPKYAYRKAEEMADDFDLTVCCGSLYLIGKIRGMIENEQKEY